MGRRKSKRKPPPKNKAVMPLDTQFNCPFCNHEKSCDVKMDKSRNTGRVSCRVCMEDYQTTINFLSEAIDVYQYKNCSTASERSNSRQDYGSRIK